MNIGTTVEVTPYRICLTKHTPDHSSTYDYSYIGQYMGLGIINGNSAVIVHVAKTRIGDRGPTDPQYRSQIEYTNEIKLFDLDLHQVKTVTENHEKNHHPNRD